MLQTFADQAVIAIENVRLFNELEARNRELTETLEQQVATGDILRVISRSPTDVQPVFDTIAAAALRLCGARSANVFTYDGELLRIGALAIVDPKGADAMRSIFPRPASRDTAACRAVLTRAVVAIPDVLEDPDFVTRHAAVAAGFRSSLGVPLMRDGIPIGAIAVGRPEASPFPEKQIALLQTFADQAVIAIENVRLFKELEARNRDLASALEQQTATAEVLSVISSSPTDVQPVFDVIAERATRLTGAKCGWVFTFDGEWIRAASSFGLNPQALAAALAFFPMRASGASYTSRAIRDGIVMNVGDALAESDPEYATKPVAVLAGYRAVLSVPMFRGQQVVGAISVNRAEVGCFADKEVALLQTFADQAVIAIENVRLFEELEERNRELTEALEQQTATSEILRVLSRSPTDAQPVFDAIAAATLKLCDANSSNVFTFDGELLHVVAIAGTSPEGMDARTPLAAAVLSWHRGQPGRAIAQRRRHSRYAFGSRLCAEESCAMGFPQHIGHSADARGQVRGRHRSRPERRGPVSRKTNRFAADLRRSGGDPAGVPDLVGDVGAVADGFACLGGFDLVANRDLHLAFQQIEMFHGSRRVGVGFEDASGLGLEIIPLGEFNEVQGADDGQAAEAILAFEDGNGGLQLMVEKGRSAVGLQHLVDAGFEGPGQAENRG